MAVPYSRILIGPISWYSFLIVLGIVLAYLIGAREEKRVDLPRDTMIDAALIAIPCGIIGSRLYFVLMNLDHFIAEPLAIFRIWEGGVAIYGAVIGGALGVYVYCRKKKLPFLRVLDMIVPGLLLAQAIGRWGNYFNMEAYGPVIENPAFQFFPLGVLIPESGEMVWHMAAFFYESMWNLAGFIALMLLRKSQKKDGNLFCWYLLIYGSGRFIIEQLRMDSLFLGNIRVSQYLSLLLCGVAAAVLLGRAAGKNRLGFGAACGAAVLAIARWFFLDSMLYVLLLLLMAVLGLYAAMESRRHGDKDGPSAALWVLGPLLVDIAGFAAWLSGWFGSALGLQLHTLICSLTLPFYVLWLTQRLAVSRDVAKAPEPVC